MGHDVRSHRLPMVPPPASTLLALSLAVASVAANFCNDRKDGFYCDPTNNTQYLYCRYGKQNNTIPCPNDLVCKNEQPIPGVEPQAQCIRRSLCTPKTPPGTYCYKHNPNKFYKCPEPEWVNETVEECPQGTCVQTSMNPPRTSCSSARLSCNGKESGFYCGTNERGDIGFWYCPSLVFQSCPAGEKCKQTGQSPPQVNCENAEGLKWTNIQNDAAADKRNVLINNNSTWLIPLCTKPRRRCPFTLF